jgi:hypothetical protein
MHAAMVVMRAERRAIPGHVRPPRRAKADVMALQITPRRAGRNRAAKAVPLEVRVVIELRACLEPRGDRVIQHRLEPHARHQHLEQCRHLPRRPERHLPWQHLVLEPP